MGLSLSKSSPFDFTMPSIAYTIDIHEDAWFALHLGGTHEALPEGDFKIVADDKVWLVERKTWVIGYAKYHTFG
jgi:hypothetical protein